jgi:transcriptional regulator with XRE-family HTH domain
MIIRKQMVKEVNPKTRELFLKAFGRLIQRKRFSKGLTQKELASRCNSTREKISRIERGVYDFKFTALISLAKGLDLQVSELFDFEIPEQLMEHFWIEPRKKDIIRYKM